MKTNTIKIPLSDLLSFKKNSSFIKSFGIIPIYDYILFDSGKIIKNNQREFVIQEVEFDGTFLIEERILYNFIDRAIASDVLFTIGDKHITITDGESTVKSKTENPENFNIPKIEDGSNISIDNECLYHIQTAANYTLPGNDGTIKEHVFICNKSISASDAFIAYHAQYENNLPEIILNYKSAEKIGSLQNVSYTETSRYNIFKTGNVIFGFIKSELKFFDFSVFFKKERKDHFIVNKKDFLSFNELCVSISPSKFILPSFAIIDNTLFLSMVDQDYDINIERKLRCSGEMEGSFSYNAALMLKILKSAPDEELIFTQAPGVYFITGESGFNTIITQTSTT